MNERVRANLAQVSEAFQGQMQAIAQFQKDRAELVAVATAEGGRVTVVVNANGEMIEARFASDIDELSYEEIARAITAAAQEAAKEVERKAKELAEPIKQRRAMLPRIEDIVDGLPDLRSRMPVAPEVSTDPPSLRDGGADLEFAEAVDYDPRNSGTGAITESGW